MPEASTIQHTQKLELSSFANDIYLQKYALRDLEGNVTEDWPDTIERVLSNVLGALGYGPEDTEYQKLREIMIARKFIPGGRYLYSAGRPLHQVNNCFLVRAEDSREGWADLLKKAAMVLQTGGGLGVEYSDIRESGAPIRRTGGIASGPVALMQMINEVGRGVIQGGARRAAIIALLDWDHPDVHDFIHLKDWPEEVKALKEKDQNFPAVMDMTNISINLDDDFFAALMNDENPDHDKAHAVYDDAIRNMVKTGEPGFSINTNGLRNEKLRNPCGEVVSSDDSDVCNLGSINLARIESKEELEEVVDYATLFLLAGTVYSDIPYDKVEEVRAKNRRIGLGVMGVHEWLLQRGLEYGPNDELGEWLEVYADSGMAAAQWAVQHKLSNPIATRSIAPTGSIGILGETTTGIEPIFCAAYKRRYLTDDQIWRYQYIVDPTAQRLIEELGVNPNDIEDAYSLSYDLERRVSFQAWIQQYVDMAVSSTINLPYQVTDDAEIQDFKDIFLKHLPDMRGITVYPDGARGGQPLEPSTYTEAVKNAGKVFEDLDASCRNGLCGA